MVGWERGMIHSCSLSQDRKNSLASAEEFSLFCKILNLSQEVTHRSRIPLLLHGQFINSQVSGSICFFATDSSSFLNLLSISCASFLEESIPHVQFLTEITIFSLSLICPLIRLIQLQSLRFEFPIGFTESDIRISLFPMSFVHVCFSLR